MSHKDDDGDGDDDGEGDDEDDGDGDDVTPTRHGVVSRGPSIFFLYLNKPCTTFPSHYRWQTQDWTLTVTL